MATHTAIYVESVDLSAFAAAIRAFLEDAHPGESISSETSNQMPIYGDMFGWIDTPTAFACAYGPENWCTAHYNCFASLEPFANSLSNSLETQVVVLNFQTVSSCYYVSVHREGQQVRAFNFEDGEQVLSLGEPLDFETDALPDLERYGGDFEEYCEELGLRIWNSASIEQEWTLIQIANQPPKWPTTATRPDTPWWKRLFFAR